MLTPLAVRIRELREVKGWSQAELARQSGVPQGMISRIENGKIESIHLPSLERLANALDCDPGFLIIRRER